MFQQCALQCVAKVPLCCEATEALLFVHRSSAKARPCISKPATVAAIPPGAVFGLRGPARKADEPGSSGASGRTGRRRGSSSSPSRVSEEQEPSEALGEGRSRRRGRPSDKRRHQGCQRLDTGDRGLGIPLCLSLQDAACSPPECWPRDAAPELAETSAYRGLLHLASQLTRRFDKCSP